MALSEKQLHDNKAALLATGAALLTLLPVAAHQLGLLDHLPDPPGSCFASDEITESRAAHPLGIPDSLLGIGSYGITLGLLWAARQTRLVHPLVRAKLGADAAAAAANSVRQVVNFRRLCSWCTGTALATAALVHYGRKSLR
jgi:uncharacterized membrane protein